LANPEPEIVTVVPPDVLPVSGETEVTTGGGDEPPPVDFGKMVASFFNGPGAVVM
jgi:hypothetical protein